MFSNALKSFSSNITSNYSLQPQPSSTAGPWKIFDAKRKNTAKAVSVFVFDKKSLDAGSSSGLSSGKGSSASLKRAHEEVTERLKREASSLARLRHPSILELVEPVEETRNGGLMFATEPVTASLASLLSEKDGQESSGGVAGRGSRFMVEEQDGSRRRRELEIDELEIQKGLLQLGKGLEFLHESAGLVHANLTPEAILINAKGDWKIAGLGFCGPHETSTTATSLVPISLHEVLNYDPWLPKIVQLNLDYSSPDFILDNSLVTAADMFSLGLLIIALYNSPHTSPISVGGSISSYKRAFSSSSSIPTQSNNFLVPSSQQLPPRLASDLLPRLITRRPAQRLTAREFQDASYFDNILVSTLRFLESLPAKTANEKTAFLRGLKGIMSQFPSSVLEKKILPALLEEMKDRELIAPILSNVFAMIETMPTGKRAFTEQVVPRLREVFTVNRSTDRDSAKEAGLVIVLESMPVIAEKCAGKEFREDILPIALSAMESSTPSLVDAGLSSLASILPVLDFTTIKNELFPVVATCFSKTNSLAIKVKGLEAFYILCGGTADTADDFTQDDLNGVSVAETKRSTSSAILDKYTVQEKIVPLLRAIKTKEPGVMMAALKVFKQVGIVADSDFLAMDVLPILWSFSLGPLLNLQQFQSFMSLIKNLSTRIEREQTKKLQELGSSNQTGLGRSSSGQITSSQGLNGLGSGEEPDFASLVSGRKAATPMNDDLMNDWSAPAARPATTVRSTSSQAVNSAPTFSWQTTQPQRSTQPIAQSTSQRGALGGMTPSIPVSRTITPDQSLGSFATLTPASPWATPLQPTQQTSTTISAMPMRPAQPAASSGNANWAATNSTSAWASQAPTQPALNGFGATSKPSPSFVLPPPPGSGSFANRPAMNSTLQPSVTRPMYSNNGINQTTAPKSGLDKFESLI
ncbi:hypothetical protein AMS68_006919 [Peltaster fructicola]|uniref:Protein kinase domain-containing protein n=1 Tax=Peltaster fructicola TaxID=286661 RepID=A0A6H0Y312_9PEZI|nr:hypothetical protein AMS68_006919 [Peltaster fructicola]